MFHEVSACHAAGYRYFHDWQELSPDQQSFLIAHYISKTLLENNQQDAVSRDMKRKTTKAKT